MCLRKNALFSVRHEAAAAEVEGARGGADTNVGRNQEKSHSSSEVKIRTCMFSFTLTCFSWGGGQQEVETRAYRAAYQGTVMLPRLQSHLCHMTGHCNLVLEEGWLCTRRTRLWIPSTYSVCVQLPPWEQHRLCGCWTNSSQSVPPQLKQTLHRTAPWYLLNNHGVRGGRDVQL